VARSVKLVIDTTEFVRSVEAMSAALRHWSWELRWELLTGRPWR